MNSAKKYSVKKCSAKDALKTALLDLLQRRSFVKISVYDLCSHAHISRSAFYVNFEDKYELLAYCLEERKAEFDHFIRNHSPEESLSALLEAIQKESHFFYHVFSEGFNDKLGRIFYRFFNQYFMELLREKECQGAVLPGPAEMVSSFYLGGLTLMILQWIKSNYKLPKEKLASCQVQLIKQIISL